MSEQAPAAAAEAAPQPAPVPEVAPPPSPPDPHEVLRARLRKHERPWHLGIRALIFVVSLAAFAWVMRDTGPKMVAIIVGVLFLHEAGHFVAMKVFGYENMKVFFVPFLGAAVSGRAQQPGGWRDGVVSLAGPLPGLLLGVALVPFASPGTTLGALVRTLVFLNALNLLPFAPLDGGRLMGTVIFSRHAALEVLGMVVGAIGLFAVPGLWAIALVGAARREATAGRPP